MKHDLNRYGYINLVVSLLVRKLYYERYKKKSIAVIISVYFTISMPSLPLRL